MPISIDLEQNPLFVEIFERYTQLGEQRGIQIGKQQGEQQGKVMMLRRLLEKRFGSLPFWVNSRLEQWSLQLLEAVSLEDVFKSRKFSEL